MALEFKLPDLGEGLSEGEIVAWKVKEGDAIAADQPLVTILTDKAEVEIPSPRAGVVLKQLFKPGQKVQVGAVFVMIGEKGETVGAAATAPAHALPSKGGRDGGGTAALAAAAPLGAGVQATPAVRKLAKELGVDLDRVKAGGPGGRVTEEDVRRAVGGASASGLPGKAAPKAPSGPEERVPFSGIRRRTAEKMVQSHQIIPSVTHVDEADVTALVALRESLKPEAAKKGVKLTYLAFVMKAVEKALRRYPGFNASLDEAAGEIVLKKHYNIGIAIDTPQGLYSPIVKEADKKDVWQLASVIEKLAAKTHDNKLEVADLQGGTFTITNIGPIGGLLATPIIIHPESAILAVMKIRKTPVVKDGQVVVRDMMNLCLSFDHRLADGAEAARFTTMVVQSLENPRTLL